MLIRLLAAIPLLAFAAFCVFGFLASFEPPGYLAFKIGYPCLGLASAAAAGYLVSGGRRRASA